MPKFLNDTSFDAALNWVITNADDFYICSAEPTGSSAYTLATTAPASSGYALADVPSITASHFTLSSGGTSGRRVQVEEVTNVTIDVTGTANYIVIVGSVASTDTVLAYTTCNAASVTAAQQWTIPEWDIELRDLA